MKKRTVIADAIRDKIHAGVYPAGTRLPSLKELCAICNVSYTTIKWALDELEAEGLIVKRRGTGTFVKSIESQELERLSTAAPSPPETTEMQLLDVAFAVPDDFFRQALQLTEGDLICQIRRTYDASSANTGGHVLETLTLPARLIPKKKRLADPKDLSHYIDEAFLAKAPPVPSRLSARMPTLTECREAGFPASAPLIEVHQLQYASNGSPCLYIVRLLGGEGAVLQDVTMLESH